MECKFHGSVERGYDVIGSIACFPCVYFSTSHLRENVDIKNNYSSNFPICHFEIFYIFPSHSLFFLAIRASIQLVQSLNEAQPIWAGLVTAHVWVLD